MDLAKEYREILLNKGFANDDIEEFFEGNDAHVILETLIIFDNHRIHNTSLRAKVLDCLGRTLLGLESADFSVRKNPSSVATNRIVLKFAQSAAIKLVSVLLVQR